MQTLDNYTCAFHYGVYHYDNAYMIADFHTWIIVPKFADCRINNYHCFLILVWLSIPLFGMLMTLRYCLGLFVNQLVVLQFFQMLVVLSFYFYPS